MNIADPPWPLWVIAQGLGGSIVADDQLVTDTALLQRWDCDVLEAEGAARLKAVVHEIKQACAQLDPGERLDF